MDVDDAGATWTARRIRDLRGALRLTQEQFAVRVGVTYATISRWENGHVSPTHLAVRRLEEIAAEAMS